MTDLHPDDDEGDTASLVRLAGPRPAHSPQRAAEARARVHAAWRRGLRRRRMRRAAFLLAAAGLAAVALSLAGRREPGRPEPTQTRVAAPPAVALARLDAATGPVEREDASGWTALAVGDALFAGPRVRTGTGGAGFRVEDGRSVRLAPGSRMRWEAAGRLTLESGAVYVDSGPRGASSSFEVRTPRGSVRETGTQFEVRLEGAALRVRVREGRVAVVGEQATLDVAGGTELRLDDEGATRRAIPSFGSEWSWALGLASGFEMEGRTLHELLAWASRESGWELRYSDAASRRRSEQARLHGSIRGARPDEAVAVIPTAGLPHRLRDGVLVVGPGAAERGGP